MPKTTDETELRERLAELGLDLPEADVAEVLDWARRGRASVERLKGWVAEREA
ncbi:hypothetical protein [Pseudoroseicyclus sp. CXY001]|uniref:hypothetical protein n=1 Tax=Pseudoroseicyclus sp. CXY001 TaxID=3242492 RepID=UPI00358DA961